MQKQLESCSDDKNPLAGFPRGAELKTLIGVWWGWALCTLNKGTHLSFSSLFVCMHANDSQKVQDADKIGIKPDTAAQHNMVYITPAQLVHMVHTASDWARGPNCPDISLGARTSVMTMSPDLANQQAPCI